MLEVKLHLDKLKQHYTDALASLDGRQGTSSIIRPTVSSVPVHGRAVLPTSTFVQNLGAILHADSALQSQINQFAQYFQRERQIAALTSEADALARRSSSVVARAFALDYSLEQLLISAPTRQGAVGSDPVHTTQVTYAWSPQPPAPATMTGKAAGQSETGVRARDLLLLSERLATSSHPPTEGLAAPSRVPDIFPLLREDALVNARLHCSLQVLLMAAQQKNSADFGFRTAEDLLAEAQSEAAAANAAAARGGAEGAQRGGMQDVDVTPSSSSSSSSSSASNEMEWEEEEEEG